MTKDRDPESPTMSRRTERTRADIHRAALQLAQDAPLEDITIEQIAEEAGVSRRTFHNHFAGKLEAFVPDMDVTDPEVMERFRAGAEPDLADAIAELLRARLRNFRADAAVGRSVLMLIRRNDALQPIIRERLHRSDATIRAAVADRLDVTERSAEAITVTNVIVSAERSALNYWATAEDESIDLSDALEAVLASLRTVLR